MPLPSLLFFKDCLDLAIADCALQGGVVFLILASVRDRKRRDGAVERIPFPMYPLSMAGAPDLA